MSAKVIFEKKLPQGTFTTYNACPTFPFKKVLQVHSSKVVSITCPETELIEADGLVADSSNHIPLVIVTADCLPILILGKKGQAFIHAGWRGLQGNILLAKEVREITPYYAFIGPAICVKHYEVGPDFKEHFPHSEQSFQSKDGQLHFNLISEAQTQLKKTYSDLKIETSSICTFEDQEFHSFRRDKTNQRNWNVFIPN